LAVQIIMLIFVIYKLKIIQAMPEIVRFYGIIIKMFFKPKEHEPSHIHAIYNEYIGLFNINLKSATYRV